MLTTVALLALLTPQTDTVPLPQAVRAGIAQVLRQVTSVGTNDLDTIFVDVPSFQRRFDASHGDSTTWQVILGGAGSLAVNRTVQVLRECDPEVEEQRIKGLPIDAMASTCRRAPPLRTLLIHSGPSTRDSAGVHVDVYLNHSRRTSGPAGALFPIVELYRVTLRDGPAGWTVAKVAPAPILPVIR